MLKDPFKRYASLGPFVFVLTQMGSPTAADLLSTPFFKSAKKKSYLISTILSDLPPLTQRQERRRQSTANTGSRTVDSWDFTTTMGGGTSGSGGSCHSHGQSQLLKSPSIYRDSPTGSFYRLSEDEERELTDCGAQGPEFGNGGKADGGAKYSTIVSWADTLDEQDRDNENETADTSDPPNSPCPDYDSKCTLANDQPIHNLPSLPLTSPSSLAVESPASPIPQPSVGSALAELDRKSVNTFTNPNHPAPVPILPRDIMSDAPMVVLSSPAASVPYPFPKQVSGVSIPEPLSLSIGPTPSLWQKITSRARLMSDIEKNKDREQEKEREKYGNGGKERDEKDSGMSVRSRFARKADAGKNAFVRTRTRSIGQ